MSTALRRIIVAISGASGAASGVTTAAVPSVSGTGSFTYDVWVNPVSFTNGGSFDGSGSYFIDRVPAGNALFSLKAVGGAWALQVRYSDGSGFNSLIGSPITTGAWTHLALVRRAGVRFELWDGGVLRATLPDSGAALLPDQIKLGSHQSFAGGGFTGQLDGVRIFNRALSPTEIPNAAAGTPSGQATCNEY